MKNIVFFSIAFLCLFATRSRAQNMPDGSAPPATSASIPLPQGNNGTNGTLKYNFVRSWSPQSPVTSTANFDLNTSNCKISTTYTSGWGQPVQSNTRLLGGDIINLSDNRAMPDKPVYLPFSGSGSSHFIPDIYNAQKSWYNSRYPGEGDNAYSRSKSIANGNNHSIVAYGPGAALTGSNRGTTVSVIANTAADNIMQLEYTSLGEINPSSNRTYAAGELTVKKTEGQHDALSYEYTNRSGQTICKRVSAGNGTFLETYYLYDEFGRITWIVTPKAVEATNNWAWNGLVPLELCFSYKYNRYGQVIERTIPGKSAPELTVYDGKHRPVLSQTALLNKEGKWAFQVYDSRSRVVFSGFVTSPDDRVKWQENIENGNAQPGTLQDYLIHECNGVYPLSIPDCDINEYSYYDHYNFPAGQLIAGRQFDTRHNGVWAFGGTYPAPQPLLYAQGLLTAKSTRVLNNGSINMTNLWVNTVLFYDQKSQLIQTQTLNPWNRQNWDVTTTRPQFDGQPGVAVSDYNWMAGTHKPVTRITDWFTYASTNNNKLATVRRSMDAGTSVNIASYTYDELGRVKSKNIGGIEIQRYTYDIAGRMTGINKDYVQDNTTPDATFGCELFYDHGFQQKRYDGSASGLIWRGAGSAAHPRAYGYLYDEAGRMTGADFYDHDNSQMVLTGTPYWDKSHVDFTVSGITYDANGNMETMKQMGMGLLNSVVQPVVMDQLTYFYQPNSNNLDRVEDAQMFNYHLNDFTNGNRNTTDYFYDDDGNLKSDKNKGITSITYNAQDLPLKVQGTQGTVENTYDAGGTLLEKRITPRAGSAVTYSYIGPMVFKDSEPEYVLHAEGRSRWLTDTLEWRHDYFVKDHLGNVRTVFTKDRGNPLNYIATYEPTMQAAEMRVFEKVTEVSAANATPSASPDNQQIAKLDGNDPDKRIGTSLLLKVMAGDKFHISAETYYEGKDEERNTDHVAGSEMATALLGALAGGAGGIEGGEGGDNAQIVDQLFGSSDFAGNYEALKEQATDPLQPRSYLSYVFFDQDMKMVPEESGVLQIGSGSNSNWSVLEKLEDIVASRNGYFGVFTSNEDYQLVTFFNNLKVTYSRGRLLEEQHYYPHGLVAVDGSQNPVKNRFLYQGKELQDEAGLQLYDFHARQYDPQIGRFWGIDPMDQFPSGYVGMGNNPANQIDPDGMQAGPTYDRVEKTASAQYSDFQVSSGPQAALGDMIWTSTGAREEGGQGTAYTVFYHDGDGNRYSMLVDAHGNNLKSASLPDFVVRAPKTEEQKEKEQGEAYSENMGRAHDLGYMPWMGPDAMLLNYSAGMYQGFGGKVNLSIGFVDYDFGLFLTPSAGAGVETGSGFSLTFGDKLDENASGPSGISGWGNSYDAGVGPVSISYGHSLNNESNPTWNFYSIGTPSLGGSISKSYTLPLISVGDHGLNNLHLVDLKKMWNDIKNER